MTAPVSTAHSRRLKVVQFILSNVDFECQLESWTVTNNTPDGAKTFTYCPSSEFRMETDDDYSLALKFFSDWRSGGISDFLVVNNKALALFQIDHHPDIVGEHVRWSGTCILKAPNVGGDARTTEETSVTLQIIGLPTYARIG